ncbi:MAG: hypothetical protein RQM95_08855 [Syntrophaceticus schinkii]
MKPVKLQDIIDEMEVQMDEYHTYLNTETGEIIAFSSEELGIAEESEEDDDFSNYPEWQRDSINDALDVLINWDSDKYIELPDKWDINEYSIMEAFCGSVRNDRIINLLFSAIKGRGAFLLPLTQFDAAILTANNGRIIATVCHKVENSGANQSLAR